MHRTAFTEMDLAVLRVAEFARQASLIEQARRCPPPAGPTRVQRLLRRLSSLAPRRLARAQAA